MQYFSNEFVRFFKELENNNNKEWFHSHKKRYEAHVKKPFTIFVGDLLEKAGMNIPVKDAVFRINRDIRFSPDKKPYKTHLAAVISSAGRKNLQIPGLYIHLEVGNVMLGGGSHMPDRENLHRIRQAIVKQPERVRDILSSKTFTSRFEGLEPGDKNKVLPAEFKSHAERIPMLYNKQFYFMAKYADENILLREDLIDFVLDHLRAGKEWNRFIAEAIGAPDNPR